ncbi:MAG: aspartate--tRNA(Asn) ligase [Nitrososphaerota archaeon]|jgi:aspartyl-tRNA synthetase|nr:aspartate--tRNA(Asn) ligase [Nitrososphaerota archaeon]MDG7045343.1 aspartate--tRNA(Asn) ligase [Nitrososphaerota archaeon]MDG7045966.1 aspartate--tRNA(Asn) ligase [Nitrososphaerota archaeon]
MTSFSNLKRKENDLRTAYSKDIDGKVEGRPLLLAGWIEDIRNLGSIVFLIVRDNYGPFQAVVKGDLAKEALALPRQSYISIGGIVKPSSGSKAFDFELITDRITVLNRADSSLPLDATGRVKADMTTMINNRPLALRIPHEKDVIVGKSYLLKAARAHLLSKGFLEVDTPKIISTSSEGGADLFKVDYFGTPAFLAQSPQLYKEELVLGLDHVFEIAHYFRAEKSNTVRHLSEFLSMDMEAALYTKEDAMALLEEIVRKIYEEISSRGLVAIRIDEEAEFPRYSYRELIEFLKSRGYEIKVGDDLTTEHLREFGKEQDGFYFIVNWPLSIKPFYTMPSPQDKLFSESFDLMHKDVEIASGGQRIHDKNMLKQRIIECGLNPNDFEQHLRVFGWGMPPHSGWGVGVDRLLMRLMGKENIRDVVLYPRDAKRLVP